MGPIHFGKRMELLKDPFLGTEKTERLGFSRFFSSEILQTQDLYLRSNETDGESKPIKDCSPSVDFDGPRLPTSPEHFLSPFPIKTSTLSNIQDHIRSLRSKCSAYDGTKQPTDKASASDGYVRCSSLPSHQLRHSL